MKIRFWLEGRGGLRSASKIVEFPDNYTDNDIKYELDEWKECLRGNSEYIQYGWDEIKEKE